MYDLSIELVKRTDGSLILEGDLYLLPRIDESFASLRGAKFCLTIDLASRYPFWSCIREICLRPLGLYEYIRMSFGVCNGPATFTVDHQHK